MKRQTPTAGEKILSILSDGKPHSNVELAQVSWRFGGILYQLRGKGYAFQKTKKEGDKKYVEYWTLIHSPKPIITTVVENGEVRDEFIKEHKGDFVGNTNIPVAKPNKMRLFSYDIFGLWKKN